MSKIRYPQGHVLLRNLSRDYPVVSHGEGLYLFDTDGKKYLDASGGALVMSLGHSHPKVAKMISEQMSRVSYVNGMQFTSQVMEDFADELVKHLPSGLDRVACLSSGSEAIEAAIKFCRQLWVERGQPERSKIIARTPGYHGNTLFALSASARPYYRKFYSPLLSDVIMIPATYEYRSKVSDYWSDGADAYVRDLEDAIIKNDPKTIMAFLVEPVIGSSAGASCPPQDYLKKCQDLCRKHGILMIADEVLCGSGRTGAFTASSHYNFEPDVMVLGKGINSGFLPMSVVAVRGKHLDEMKNGSGGFMHAQTYLQAPSMAAAGLAVLNVMKEEKILENAANVGAIFQKTLRERLLGLDWVGHISGRGMLAGVEFVEDKATKKPFDRSRKFAEQFIAHAFSEGLILWPNTGHADGVNGDLVMLGPPLNITIAQVNEIVDLFEKTLLSFKNRFR